MKDVENLLVLFNELADKGNVLIIIEHNKDVLNNSDFLIELGPGGGDGGGMIV